MNKTTLKIISKISEQLPMQLYNSKCLAKISGEDAILAGTLEINGEPTDPEKEYVVNNILQRDVDHKSRMKKIFNKRGKVGLITYLRPFFKREKFGPIQVVIMNYCV
jgi:hypothetical protein